MTEVLSHERLLHLIYYDPATGEMTWLNPPPCPVARGDRAGSVHHTGYLQVRLDGRVYQASRVAWFYVHGVWPDPYDIDHKNGDPIDNRIKNLRCATPTQNMGNRKRNFSSVTGFKGVSRSRGKFAAEIAMNGKRTWLGRFETAEAAHAAYMAEAGKLFGQFARAE
jgi:hypothetical protein